MCKGNNCPIKETCYRYTAKPLLSYQSYFTEIWYDRQNLTCEYYWYNESK